MFVVCCVVSKEIKAKCSTTKTNQKRKRYKDRTSAGIQNKQSRWSSDFLQLFTNFSSSNNNNFPNNKPDTIFRDNKKGKCVSNRCCNLGDRNVIKKEGENIPKYKDLAIEIHGM
jgi:hypothetical protein